MTTGGKIVSLTLFALMGATVQAQSAPTANTAKPAKVKPKTQEQLQIDQLNEKVQAIDQLSQKYQGLEQQVEQLKTQLQQANTAAATAEADAAAAKQALADSVGHSD